VYVGLIRTAYEVISRLFFSHLLYKLSGSVVFESVNRLIACRLTGLVF